MWFILPFLFVLSSAQSGQSDEDNLLYAVVVFREGDRSPLYIPDNDPFKSKWMEAGGYGVVTETGQQKMFSFGEYIQKRYYKDMMRSKITKKTVTVRSTKYERHIVSARKVLEGLTSSLPESIKLEEIPILTNSDDVLMVDTCPAYNQEMLKQKSNTVVKKLEREESQFYKLIQENTKCQCNSLQDVNNCMDPLFCECTEGFGLPSWCNSTCYERAMKLLDVDWKLEISNPKLLNLKMQPFINLMLKKIERYVSGVETIFQLNLFSSIGYSIPMLIESIGVENFEPHVPKFGAALFIELRSIGAKKIVNLFYQPSEVGVVKKLHIKGCGEDCEYSKLVEILPPLLKKKRLPCGA